MIEISSFEGGLYQAAGTTGDIIFSAQRLGNGSKGYASSCWAHKAFPTESALPTIVALLDEFDSQLGEAGALGLEVEVDKGANSMLTISGCRWVSINLGPRKYSIGDLAGYLNELIGQYLDRNPVMFASLEVNAPYGVVELLARDPTKSRDDSLSWSPGRGFFRVKSHQNISMPLNELIRETIAGQEQFRPGSLAKTLRDVYKF